MKTLRDTVHVRLLPLSDSNSENFPSGPVHRELWVLSGIHRETKTKNGGRSTFVRHTPLLPPPTPLESEVFGRFWFICFPLPPCLGRVRVLKFRLDSFWLTIDYPGGSRRDSWRRDKESLLVHRQTLSVTDTESGLVPGGRHWCRFRTVRRRSTLAFGLVLWVDDLI